jgi:hypothetical protein
VLPLSPPIPYQTTPFETVSQRVAGLTPMNYGTPESLEGLGQPL